MIRNKLLALTATALLALSLTTNANQAVEAAVTTKTDKQPANINMFDPNYWMSAMANPALPAISTELKFNAAHPGAWMQWIDPKTHVQTHMAFMNPATYAQFVQPQFYMEFTKPENMAAWMDFNQYQVVMDPQTMYYWMNPGSYMHMIDPNMYTAAMNPANYMIYMNPATYAGWAGAQTCDPKNPNRTQAWFGYTC